MEEAASKKSAMAAVRAAMPGTVRLVAEKRKELGDEWVTHCIAQAMAGHPGWFYAREGAMGFGVPWDMGETAMGMLLKPVTPTQCLVFIRDKGVAGGA